MHLDEPEDGVRQRQKLPAEQGPPDPEAEETVQGLGADVRLPKHPAHRFLQVDRLLTGEHDTPTARADFLTECFSHVGTSGTVFYDEPYTV